MGKLLIPGGSGGADTSVVTAGASDVIENKVIVDASGNPLTGTLKLTGSATESRVLSGYTFYNTDAKTILTGSLAVTSAINFSAATLSGSSIRITWTNPSKGAWSGVKIRYSTSSYPGVSGGTLVYTGTGSSTAAGGSSYVDIAGLNVSTTYYFTCYSYATGLGDSSSSYNCSAKTGGLVLYNYGATSYTLTKRHKGVINSDRCTLSTTSYLVDYYGSNDIDSTLMAPAFCINAPDVFTSSGITKYSQIQITYNIGSALASSSRNDGTRITIGGWAGWDWDYNDSLDYKENKYFWKCQVTHAKDVTGTFTSTFSLGDTSTANSAIKFFKNTSYCTTSTYITRAKNLYFGAYTHVKDGDDYREVYCYVPVNFYSIKLL